jgi:hypothetical protein
MDRAAPAGYRGTPLDVAGSMAGLSTNQCPLTTGGTGGFEMEFDRGRRYAGAREAAQHDVAVAGKHTLSERIPVQQVAQPAGFSPAAVSAPAAPLGGPRPTLQMLFGHGHGDAAETDRTHAAALRGTATAATQLPHLDLIQRSFGRHDVSGVKAHVGAEAAASAREMGAQAYATGDHVVLGNTTDLHITAHEAAHVVQQRGGVQLKAGVGEVGDAYERHADEVANTVVQGKSAEALLDPYAGSAGPAGVQRLAMGTAIQAYPGVVPAAVDPDVHKGVRDQFTGAYVVSNTRWRVNETPNTFNGKIQYVVTQQGDMWVGTRGQGFPHPCLIGGVNPQVSAAGEILFYKGTPVALNTKSGHFQPPAECANIAKFVIARWFPNRDIKTGDHNYDIGLIRPSQLNLAEKPEAPVQGPDPGFFGRMNDMINRPNDK